MWDATPTFLTQNFYLSMNTPVDEELYNISGYWLENEEDGDNYWSYYNSARFCITSQRLVNVNTLQDFQSFVRYNDWMHDPC